MHSFVLFDLHLRTPKLLISSKNLFLIHIKYKALILIYFLMLFKELLRQHKKCYLTEVQKLVAKVEEFLFYYWRMVAQLVEQLPNGQSHKYL